MNTTDLTVEKLTSRIAELAKSEAEHYALAVQATVQLKAKDQEIERLKKELESLKEPAQEMEDTEDGSAE